MSGPSQASGPPPPPAASSTPPWIRWVVGFGVGCGVVGLVLLIAALVAGWKWIAPGKQVPTEWVLGPESAVVIQVSDSGGRSGLGRIAAHFLAEQERKQRARQELPAALRWLETMQRQQAASGASLWIPREATLVLDPSGPEPTVLVAANYKFLPRPLRDAVLEGALERGEATESRLGKHRIVRWETGRALCFHGGTLVYANDVSLIPGALERLDAGESRPPPSAALARRLEQLKPTWPLLGLADNSGGRLHESVASHVARFRCAPDRPLLPEGEKGREMLAAVEGASLGVQVDSADSLHAELILSLVDEPARERWRPALAGCAEALAETLETEGVELTWIMDEQPTRLHVRLEMQGLAGAISRWVEQQAAELPEPEE